MIRKKYMAKTFKRPLFTLMLLALSVVVVVAVVALLLVFVLAFVSYCGFVCEGLAFEPQAPLPPFVASEEQLLEVLAAVLGAVVAVVVVVVVVVVVTVVFRGAESTLEAVPFLLFEKRVANVTIACEPAQLNILADRDLLPGQEFLVPYLEGYPYEIERRDDHHQQVQGTARIDPHRDRHRRAVRSRGAVLGGIVQEVEPQNPDKETAEGHDAELDRCLFGGRRDIPLAVLGPPEQHQKLSGDDGVHVLVNHGAHRDKGVVFGEPPVGKVFRGNSQHEKVVGQVRNRQKDQVQIVGRVIGTGRSLFRSPALWSLRCRFFGFVQGPSDGNDQHKGHHGTGEG
eukprot:CAMPEP_0201142994 /NCGR_PEP_ID=MMETSP0851-20130426/4708_1 /ASSEMBLY_ACC=CAM_ASM_000631 /TAXON_ID=183588 /ORGANISM="Pseudo-nitzschia fraudulenta, Strain WWA7" /LENGTH=340 /DNA_ID=CAMNT_0047416991 /DNA_START=851 /DNA_END=1872 /DNA_ORIENTATION=+